jgi:hypothetical protein
MKIVYYVTDYTVCSLLVLHITVLKIVKKLNNYYCIFECRKADIVVNNYTCILPVTHHLQHIINYDYFQCFLSHKIPYFCVLIQFFQNITWNLPPQHSFTSVYITHNSPVNTSHSRICLLQCLVKSVILNVNNCLIIALVLKSCNLKCAWCNINSTISLLQFRQHMVKI